MFDKVTYQNNTTRNYVYDLADRVSSITNNFSNNQSESFAYGYDANSNRVTETKQATNQATKSINYQYDNLDRLSQVKTTTPTTSQIDYTYDAVGNRKTEIGVDQYGNNVNRTATYDDLNQLTTLTSGGNFVENFEYDNNGNLAKHKQNNVEVERYEYDIRNQLSKYTGVGNGVNVTFDYDFERKRTSKTSANSTTNYTYAGNQVVNETKNNVASASYTIGGGEIVKSEFSNGENNYHFTDALGSVTSLTNNAGALTSRSDYDAFGLQTGGSSSNSIGYTGQRLDNETGLMALGNGERYYSPSYARFIQQDSVSGKPMTPQSLNRFAYGLNNPLAYTDLNGNEAEQIQGGLKNDFYSAGFNAKGEEAYTGGWVVNGASKTAYDVWDFISGGILQQNDTVTTQHELGKISDEEYANQRVYMSGKAVVILASMLVGGLAGRAVGGVVAESSFAIRAFAQFTTGAAVSGGAQFGVETIEKKAGWRDSYSSLGEYAFNSFLGGAMSLIGIKRGKVAEPEAFGTSKNQPKQLGDGGVQERIESGKLLKSAPKETRFYSNENGSVYDSKPSGKTPWESVEELSGHGNSRHGSQTTMQEQITRVKTGTAPDGEVASTSRATKFDNAIAELDAVKRAEIKINEIESSSVQNKRVIELPQSGSGSGARLPRMNVVVGGKKGGYGSGFTAKDPITGQIYPKNMGLIRPVFPTGQDPNASVTMQYNPLSSSWKPVTQFPTDKPIP